MWGSMIGSDRIGSDRSRSSDYATAHARWSLFRWPHAMFSAEPAPGTRMTVLALKSMGWELRCVLSPG